MFGVVGLCFGAFLIRYLAWRQTAVMFNDGPVFIGLARLISSGEWSAALAHPFHPLYPFAIAIAQGFIERWDSAAAAVSILAGTASTAALFWFLRAAFDRQIAWVGSFLFAVHPYAVAHSADVQSDGLYTFLFLSSVALLWRAYREISVGAALGAGLVAGLAYLTRPEGLGVVLVGVGGCGVLIAFRRWGIGRGAMVMAALAAGALLLVAPYVMLLHAQSGAWVITQKKSASLGVVAARPSPLGAEAIVQDPFLETVVRGPRVPERVVDVAASKPERWARVSAAGFTLVQTLCDAMRPEIVAFVVLVLLGAICGRAPAGLVKRLGIADSLGGRRGLRGRPSREVFIAALVCAYLVVLFMLALLAGYLSRRHVLPVGILFLGYAAAGVPLVGGWLLAQGRRLWPAIGPATPARAALVGTCLAVLIALPLTLQERRSERAAEREAAEWLGNQSAARGAPVAAYKQRTAYYAGAPHVRLHDLNTPEALATLREAGARYLIVGEHDLGESGALGRATYLGLQAIHRTTARGWTAVVYELPEDEGWKEEPVAFADRVGAG
jgi:4-amino-4-deoxy-L-arabinose transferase-like glycosyltransferase